MAHVASLLTSPTNSISTMGYFVCTQPVMKHAMKVSAQSWHGRYFNHWRFIWSQRWKFPKSHRKAIFTFLFYAEALEKVTDLSHLLILNVHHSMFTGKASYLNESKAVRTTYNAYIPSTSSEELHRSITSSWTCERWVDSFREVNSRRAALRL